MLASSQDPSPSSALWAQLSPAASPTSANSTSPEKVQELQAESSNRGEDGKEARVSCEPGYELAFDLFDVGNPWTQVRLSTQFHRKEWLRTFDRDSVDSEETQEAAESSRGEGNGGQSSRLSRVRPISEHVEARRHSEADGRNTSLRDASTSSSQVTMPQGTQFSARKPLKRLRSPHSASAADGLLPDHSRVETPVKEATTISQAPLERVTRAPETPRRGKSAPRPEGVQGGVCEDEDQTEFDDLLKDLGDLSDEELFQRSPATLDSSPPPICLSQAPDDYHKGGLAPLLNELSEETRTGYLAPFDELRSSAQTAGPLMFQRYGTTNPETPRAGTSHLSHVQQCFSDSRLLPNRLIGNAINDGSELVVDDGDDDNDDDLLFEKSLHSDAADPQARRGFFTPASHTKMTTTSTALNTVSRSAGGAVLITPRSRNAAGMGLARKTWQSTWKDDGSRIVRGRIVGGGADNGDGIVTPTRTSMRGTARGRRGGRGFARGVASARRGGGRGSVRGK